MTQHDWVAIERAYRQGGFSISALARDYCLSEGSIRYHVRNNGWTRDIDPLSMPNVSEAVDAPPTMLLKQRKAVTRLNRLHDKLADKARIMVDDATSLKELADASAAVERLTRITEKVISLERLVFGMDTASETATAGLAEALRRARERCEAFPPD